MSLFIVNLFPQFKTKTNPFPLRKSLGYEMHPKDRSLMPYVPLAPNLNARVNI